MTKVKICGITTVDDALMAVEAGADAVGLVFYDKSLRFVNVEQAASIVAALPPFVQVVGLFVNAPLAVCEQRDTKGLYKKARAGEIKQFTGISSAYEMPDNPEVILHTDRETSAESVAKVVGLTICLVACLCAGVAAHYLPDAEISRSYDASSWFLVLNHLSNSYISWRSDHIISPLLSHFDGRLLTTGAEAWDEGQASVALPVDWLAVVGRLRLLGAPLLECGYGRQLAGLTRWADRDLLVSSLQRPPQRD